MSLSDPLNNFGSWSIKLRSKAGRDDNGKPLPAAPQALLDLFAVTDGPDAFLGHIIVTSQAFDPLEVDVLALSRYTGVLRESKFSSDDVEISGSGLVYWLGDLQERGPIFEDELNLDGESFTDGIEAILPDSIVPGNIIPEIGSASANYLFVTARAALEDWLSLFGAEYYITPQGELNAGTPASLFPSFNNPTTFVIRKGSGADMNLKPLPLGSATFSGDMTNFATKVISLVQVEETSFLEGMAEESTSKRDLHGNLVSITDINNETTTLAANADARAAARLAQIGVPRTSVELSTENYDIHGDFKPGDSIWVYDVPSGLYDLSNEVQFRGQTYWPVKLRVLEITYPVTKGMGVYFRPPTADATIYDLTPYFIPEPAGTSQIEVGTFTRSMIPPSAGGIGGVIAPVLNPESPPPIPDPPTIFSEERSVLVKQPTTSGGNPMPATVTKFNVYASTTSGFTPGPTNYIGYISVVRADVITLGIPLLKSFKWESEDLTYFRTTAINSGGEGPASIEVSETAGLIPNAAILNLDAEKINAGTINVAIELNAAVVNGGEINASDINGSVITGGVVQTALTGQRVALEGADADRIKFYTGIVTESETGFIASSSADGNLGIHATEFSTSGGDTADIMLAPAGGPMAFDHSVIWVQAEEVLLGKFGSASSVQVEDNLNLVSSGNITSTADGDIVGTATGDITLTAETMNFDFNAGVIAVNGSRIDLFHDDGGRVFVQVDVQLIAGGVTQGIFDDIPGGGTGDSGLRVNIEGIGMRRLIADVSDSGGTGFRRIVVAN